MTVTPAVYVDHYNRVRLHSAIGYVTPLAKLEGREPLIFAERDCKLEEARRQRQLRRQQARATSSDSDLEGFRLSPLSDRVGDSVRAALN